MKRFQTTENDLQQPAEAEELPERKQLRTSKKHSETT